MNCIDKKLMCVVIVLLLIAFSVSVQVGLIFLTAISLAFLFRSKPEQQQENYVAYSRDNSCNKNISEACIKFNSDPFRTKPVVVEKNMKSINNELLGGANPKTLIPPMITRPCYSLDWRDTTMVKPNMTNDSSNENLYLSGYLSPPEEEPPVENFEYSPEQEPVENFVEYGEKTWSDAVNTVSGVNKSQYVDAKFPANLPQPKCERSAKMAEFNENLFTQTVQPGVYYKNDVIEPVNANIGISFQQEFLPRTFKRIANGIEIEDHNPEFAPAPEAIIEPVVEPRYDNVYDPRFTGYGTSYRNYVDDVTGQPRFPYDDVTAVRMPNYVVRSKIDTHNFADKYDSMQNAGISLNDIRSKVQDAYLQDNLQHRDDLMSKLMRKRNSEMWQIRQAPKYTM